MATKIYRNVVVVVLILFFIVGCVNLRPERVLYSSKVKSGSDIFVISKYGSELFWVMKKDRSGCYFTGKVEGSLMYSRMKIANENDSGFSLLIAYSITPNDTNWIKHQINYKDTFCIDNDCNLYPKNAIIDCKYPINQTVLN